MRYLCLLALSLLMAVTAVGQPVDLDSCQDDLDRLRRRSADASEAADKAKSRLSDLNSCKDNPEVYDIWHNGCRTLRSDYESAIGDLRSSMDDVDSSLHSVCAATVS